MAEVAAGAVVGEAEYRYILAIMHLFPCCPNREEDSGKVLWCQIWAVQVRGRQPDTGRWAKSAPRPAAVAQRTACGWLVLRASSE